MSDLLIAATSLLEEIKKLQLTDIFLYMEYAEQYSAALKLAEEEVKTFSEHQLKVGTFTFCSLYSLTSKSSDSFRRRVIVS